MAPATVLVPLILFAGIKVFTQGEQGGEQPQQEGWWWDRWEGPPEERYVGLGRSLVYLWSLTLFAFVVWRGHRVLATAKDDERLLQIALVFFGNLSFVAWILMATSGQREGGGGDQEDGVWLSSFSAVITLTFCFWTVFSWVFAGILYDRARKRKASTPTASSYTLWGNEAH